MNFGSKGVAGNWCSLLHAREAALACKPERGPQGTPTPLAAQRDSFFFGVYTAVTIAVNYQLNNLINPFD
jgi:hypothetical protein